MRLWHQNLIPKLPRQQLLGQWRECIALLGNGWGRKHKTVDYVFKHDVSLLYWYTLRVSNEMLKRGYKANLGCIINALDKRNVDIVDISDISVRLMIHKRKGLIFPEHDDIYMKECLDNLKGKGINII